jgi:hypothetical protein
MKETAGRADALDEGLRARRGRRDEEEGREMGETEYGFVGTEETPWRRLGWGTRVLGVTGGPR